MVGASSAVRTAESSTSLKSVVSEHDKINASPESTSAIDAEKNEPSNGSIVEWDGPLDPNNPMNFSLARKWIMTISLSLFNATTTFSSSVFSVATATTAKEFHVSDEVMILGTTLYLAGFVIGPVISGPLSELYGRTRPLFIGFFIFAVFQVPVAVAQNLATVLVCRFLQGLSGSAAQGVTGGALTDFWNAQERGFAVAAFSAALFVGPVLGPVIGSFINASYLGWRWTQWVTLIMAAVVGILGVIAIPETYHPILLTNKAMKLRHQTKDWSLHSAHEEREVKFNDILTKYLLRPAAMLFLEPILFLVTLYIAFVFGIIYLLFEAFPISYGEERGYSEGIASLPFIAVLIGALLGCLLVGTTTKTRLAPNPAEGRVQEARLILMAFGGLALMLGLFWFAWTSFPSINPWPQVISGVPIGFGIILITQQGINYVIDCYTRYANSALAANTSIRYCFGAGFPLFASQMFRALGVQWAASVLAFISLALLPVPVLFYRYGPKIRAMSRYVPD